MPKQRITRANVQAKRAELADIRERIQRMESLTEWIEEAGINEALREAPRSDPAPPTDALSEWPFDVPIEDVLDIGKWTRVN